MTNLETFTQQLNTTFKINSDDSEQCELELVEALSHDNKNTLADSKSYSLLFRYSRSAPLQQSVYSLKHDALGIIDIFLVPQIQDEKHHFMEAVFNI